MKNGPELADRPEKVVRVNWERMVEEPVHRFSTINSGRAFCAFRDTMGALSRNGPCSRNPSWKRQSKAVVRRSHVPVRAATSEPADGHQR